MPPSSSSRALLRGLGHPAPDEIKNLRDLVEWLEHTKIRAYPADARGPLTNQPEGPQWRASLAKYLDDVGCPRQAAAGAGAGAAAGAGKEENAAAADASAADEAVASWLLYHALSLSYGDAKEKFSEDKETALISISRQVQRGISAVDEADAAAPAAGGGPPFVDLRRGAVRRACDELCLAVGVASPSKEEGAGGDGEGEEGKEGDGGGGALALARRLERAEEALTERYLPAASAFAEAEAQRRASASSSDPTSTPSSSSSSSSASAFAAALLDAQPLGFSTGDDPTVDRGARALRWLYVKDLALLQKRVDDAIVRVQDRTANPRTDSALGKVGR